MERGNYNLVAIFLLIISCFCGVMLVASSVLADNDTVIDQVNVTVEESCTLAGVGMDSHVATLHNAEYSGQSGSDYVNGIGKTTLTAFCNDYNGFSIYAVGFTGDSYTDTNHTKLVGATDNNNTISTGLYTSGDTTSSWAMKIDKITDGTISYIPANMSIQNSFDSWHLVPDTYTKVAQYHANSGSSVTDTVLGGKLETTYQAYVSASQAADTYEGKVKYTLVHPYNEVPAQPQGTSPGKICYYANTAMADGTMGCQTISDLATTAKLFASNFSRSGYGFAGWSDAFDYATNVSANFYGPNETISFAAGQYTGSNPGLSLYAVWVPSAGSFQNTSDTTAACNAVTAASTSGTRTLASVSALTDERDNQTYAIAKLADNKCWMIENLRLDNTAQLTTLNTNNPLNDGTDVTLKHNYTDTQTYNTLSATSSVVYNETSSPDGWCTSQSAACYDQSRLRTDNTVNRVSYASDATMSTSANLYTYGNYYNWYSATAGRGTYGLSTNNNSTAGDLCPTNWRLPKGGNKARIESNDDNDFWNLVVDALNGGINPANYTSSTKPIYDGSAEAGPVDALIRTWPNNFVHSGLVEGASLSNRGFGGYYWSSTANMANYAYDLSFRGTNVTPGSGTPHKHGGRTIRCMALSGS
ncbi:hypothetical protein IJI28_03100 [Candidatus Saccharibacteria bacterium]|nr:hypothetical protein [Candidatus Saccharibacteria bacterium]